MTADNDSICTNFAVVRQFNDPDRVVAIRDTILSLNRNGVTRADVDRRLETPLTTREAAALFTCLQKNGAATQLETDKQGFSDYTFEVCAPEVDRVLTQQAAVIAADGRSSQTDQDNLVNFVATLPGGFEPTSARVRTIPDIASTIRNQVFDADSSVRIANPYFDPSLELVSDLASLPQRGIETQLLTRETADKEGDTRTTLNKMWDRIDEENRGKFEVRDLYQWDKNQGSQAFATHAKIVIVDDRVCYVGSANLTDTSLSTNFEFGVVVEGDIVEDAATVFDEVFEYSHPVDLPI
ncbi:phospholipase D-like domain-containing protein [Halosegnis longus]|uniref:phospholipase D-like domain-containing protein n=1 Tax=Halosegnis longus TaxID=2216012 RepID=UPI0013564EED|nr:phospholipase D family protein [Salella cibi]